MGCINDKASNLEKEETIQKDQQLNILPYSEEFKEQNLPTRPFRLTQSLQGGGALNEFRGVQFSPDGTKLISGDAGIDVDVFAQVWDVSTGNVLQTFKFKSSIQEVRFNVKDSNNFFCVFMNNPITELNISSGNVVRTFDKQPLQLYSFDMSLDGTKMVTGYEDNSIILWDVASGKQLKTLQDSGAVNSVCFSPDGTKIASGLDNTVKIWDIASSQILTTIKAANDNEFGNVNRVHFSPDGMKLASASSTVKIWDVSSGQMIKNLPDSEAFCVRFSPDGKYLITGGYEKSVKVWNVSSGVLLQELKEHYSGVNNVAISRDGTKIASAGNDEKIKIWERS